MHALLAIPVCLLLWGFSGPGLGIFTVGLALLGLAAFGVTWVVRVAAYAANGGRRFGIFALAPAVVVLVFVLLVTGVPAQLRWAVSRPAFDRVAVDLAVSPDTATPGRIGLYNVGHVENVPGGWIIYEDGGSGFVDDAGFAYLPAGPTADLGDGSWENPRFHHLGGPWYSWTASW